MIPTVPTPLASKLDVGVGYARNADVTIAAREAAETAAAALGDTLPEIAFVVTAGAETGDVVHAVREVLGPVSVAGGAMPCLLTDEGPIMQGALVIAIVNADGAVSGVAAMGGRDLTAAGQAAARMVLAGWPFRARYPRGLGLAFTRAGESAPAFLEAWREFMGPKMRTVCSTGGDGTLYGMSSAAPRVSVGCLEAPYATGLGYADGAGLDGTPPSVETLVHGAADATLTAVKRLDGRPPHLILVVEGAGRRRALGDAARAEWTAIRSRTDESAPCVGWVCERVAAYGRGVQPSAGDDALIVLTLGDAPRA